MQTTLPCHRLTNLQVFSNPSILLIVLTVISDPGVESDPSTDDLENPNLQETTVNSETRFP